MDYTATRKNLLAEAADLRAQSRAQRETVDRSVVDIKALTATSRTTIARSWQTLDRLNRSLRQYRTQPNSSPSPT